VTVRRLDTTLEGLVLLEPQAFTDERGFFLETYNQRAYHDIGIDVEFVQDNHSRSIRHTIRGLHYQVGQGQDKLVSVARGHIWDVAVDIRPASPTFGRWEAFELDDVSHRQLFVPVGFAHGFCVLSETADVAYKVSSYYDPSAERGIAWDDPTIGIAWPTTEPVLSERDLQNPRLADVTD
jgi:dTDP-4-dehydrorhamnose 3,5-epimerase